MQWSRFGRDFGISNLPVCLSDSHIASILYLFLRSILRSIERQSFLQWFLDARHNCSAKERIGQADASVFVFVKWISEAFAAVFYSDWKKYLLRSIFFSVAFFFFLYQDLPFGFVISNFCSCVKVALNDAV